VLDAADEIADATEASAANRLLGNQAEPAFHLIEPGRVGRREMDVEAGPLCQPEAHLGMLVGGIVVDDQMGVKVFRHGLVNALDKPEKLLMPVPRPALGEDGSGGDIQRGKQGGGAMVHIAVRDPFHITRPMGNTGWLRLSA